jgi:hypothetical protein
MKMKSRYTAEQIREARTIIATINAEKANRVIGERYTPDEIKALKSKAARIGNAQRGKKAREAALAGAPSAA